MTVASVAAPTPRPALDRADPSSRRRKLIVGIVALLTLGCIPAWWWASEPDVSPGSVFNLQSSDMTVVSADGIAGSMRALIQEPGATAELTTGIFNEGRFDLRIDSIDFADEAMCLPQFAATRVSMGTHVYDGESSQGAIDAVVPAGEEATFWIDLEIPDPTCTMDGLTSVDRLTLEVSSLGRQMEVSVPMNTAVGVSGMTPQQVQDQLSSVTITEPK